MREAAATVAAANVATAVSTVGGVVGAIFPKSASTQTGTTTASRRNLLGGD